MYIRKNDEVVVIAGKEKGRRGKVLRVLRDRNRVIVEKINMVKRHQKPTQTNPAGGIITKEAPLHLSNVNLFCEKCDGPSRIGAKVNDDGTKDRICKKCEGVIEAKE